MTTPQFCLYGWPSSPYSTKVLAYLRYRRASYRWVVPDWFGLRDLRRRLGFTMVPVLTDNDGLLLQDSTAIIDAIEARSTPPSIYPSAVLPHLGALLLELLADEWYIGSALHYRWNTPGNRAFILADFGDCLAPWLPRFLRPVAGKQIAKQMQAHLRRVGVVGATHTGWQALTKTVLDAFEQVLAEQPFLQGERPTIADFAWVGQLYAHHYRDAGTRDLLFAERPAVIAWMLRLIKPDPAIAIQKLALRDDLHPALLPLLQLQAREQLPVLQATAQKIAEHLAQRDDGLPLPQQLGPLDFTVCGTAGSRLSRTFSVYRWQRALDFVAQLVPSEHASLGAKLVDLGLNTALTPLPFRLSRRRFQLVASRISR